MSLREDALRQAAIRTLKDALDALERQGKDALTAQLLEHYDADGVKSLDVRVGDKKVATISLAIPKAGYAVTDPEAFLEWVEVTYPDAVVTPPVTSHVAPKWQEEFVKTLAWIDGGIYDPATGEEVPGVEYHEAGRPTYYSIRFDADGRQAIADAWSRGDLAALMDGVAPGLAPLPAGDES